MRKAALPLSGRMLISRHAEPLPLMTRTPPVSSSCLKTKSKNSVREKSGGCVFGGREKLLFTGKEVFPFPRTPFLFQEKRDSLVHVCRLFPKNKKFFNFF
jgi:hypothetical protein